MTLRSHLEGQKPPARFIEIQSWELIADLATRGIGIGLIPDFLLKDQPLLKKVRSPVPLPGYEVAAFTRRASQPSSAAKAFMDHLVHERL